MLGSIGHNTKSENNGCIVVTESSCDQNMQLAQAVTSQNLITFLLEKLQQLKTEESLKKFNDHELPAQDYAYTKQAQEGLLNKCRKSCESCEEDGRCLNESNGVEGGGM